MKFNKLSLALAAAVALPMTAQAGVTVSPLLLGYIIPTLTTLMTNSVKFYVLVKTYSKC